ncbi:Protein of unknown function [Pyronema omphalodes CBS 100304]|uniref:Uncharacterized protein n=1 Tax=Pyronema omphalodes (strain CBS 100304) TaxID=1076935 RepID=U4LD70_PYROM|nr:Protein of unknown function [Pyronema omphalodes CBS 100304]
MSRVDMHKHIRYNTVLTVKTCSDTVLLFGPAHPSKTCTNAIPAAPNSPRHRHGTVAGLLCQSMLEPVFTLTYPTQPLSRPLSR